MTPPDYDPLIDAARAAEYLGVSKNTLASWRHNKRYDLSYIKVGERVLYRRSALEDFIKLRTRA